MICENKTSATAAWLGAIFRLAHPYKGRVPSEARRKGRNGRRRAGTTTLPPGAFLALASPLQEAADDGEGINPVYGERGPIAWRSGRSGRGLRAAGAFGPAARPAYGGTRRRRNKIKIRRPCRRILLRLSCRAAHPVRCLPCPVRGGQFLR